MSNHSVTASGGSAPNLPQPTLEIMQRQSAVSSGNGAEMQRVLAEVQAQIYLAKSFPRNPIECRQKIMLACENLSLAKDATYSFARGGTDIAGASIDLLTAIATQWGNIDFGAKEVSRRTASNGKFGESDVVVWAKDLETNTTRRMEFVVTHSRDTRQGSKALTDERDIYENIANNAARRMRRCMEDIIPRDVVDDAVEQCRKTVVSKADVNEETIKKLVDAFSKIKVSKAQIEKRIQRKVEAMQPATYVKMREIYKSIQDGMSEASDWFDAVVMDASSVAEVKTEPKPVAAAVNAATGTTSGPEGAELGGSATPASPSEEGSATDALPSEETAETGADNVIQFEE